MARSHSARSCLLFACVSAFGLACGGSSGDSRKDVNADVAAEVRGDVIESDALVDGEGDVAANSRRATTTVGLTGGGGQLTSKHYSLDLSVGHPQAMGQRQGTTAQIRVGPTATRHP